MDSLFKDILLKYSIEHAACSVLWFDQDAKVVYGNQTACSSLGYSDNELLNLFAFDIYPDYTTENWHEHWQIVKDAGTIQIESQHLTKSGATFPIEVVIQHVEIDDQQFHYHFVRNTHEQRKMEHLLRQSEERFRLTLDATSNGMWDRNLETDEVYYGANWASSLGYKEEDLRSGVITWQSLLHPDDKEETLQAVQDHIDGKTSFYIKEFRLLNSNQQYQWILARGKIIQRDEQGNPLRFVGTQTDITERKKGEEKLKQQSEKIRLFAYSIAHDLKNPAISIKGLATRLHTLHQDMSQEDIKIYSSKILQSSEQIEELVDKLNVFVSTKESPLVVEEISLPELLEKIYAEFSDDLDEHGITWQQCPTPSTIKADKVSILRVIRNFVDNALKYGGEPLSTISIDYQEDQHHHIISVSDDGVGLSQRDAVDAFSAFERKSTSKGVSGTGLGLAIVKEVARQHNGSVWADTDSNGGITFCFSVAKNL